MEIEETETEREGANERGRVFEWELEKAREREREEMAPLAIAGLLFGGRIRAPREFATATGVRRAMSQAIRDGLGSVFSKNEKALTRVVNVCRAR